MKQILHYCYLSYTGIRVINSEKTSRRACTYTVVYNRHSGLRLALLYGYWIMPWRCSQIYRINLSKVNGSHKYVLQVKRILVATEHELDMACYCTSGYSQVFLHHHSCSPSGCLRWNGDTEPLCTGLRHHKRHCTEKNKNRFIFVELINMILANMNVSALDIKHL